jgi:hypothetical protein
LFDRLAKAGARIPPHTFILRFDSEGVYGDLSGRREESLMKRFIKAAVAAIVLTMMLALPAQGAASRTVKWVCIVDGQPVTFVSAPEAARPGIEQANMTAGQVFNTQFGEVCSVG